MKMQCTTYVGIMQRTEASMDYEPIAVVCGDCGALGVAVDAECGKAAAIEHIIEEHDGAGTVQGKEITV